MQEQGRGYTPGARARAEAYPWKKGGDIIRDTGQIFPTLEANIGKPNTR
jgi:hypothetical protein